MNTCGFDKRGGCESLYEALAKFDPVVFTKAEIDRLQRENQRYQYKSRTVKRSLEDRLADLETQKTLIRIIKEVGYWAAEEYCAVHELKENGTRINPRAVHIYNRRQDEDTIREFEQRYPLTPEEDIDPGVRRVIPLGKPKKPQKPEQKIDISKLREEREEQLRHQNIDTGGMPPVVDSTTTDTREMALSEVA